MAEAPLAVASAVILPDAEEASQSPSLKRRQSSISETDSKRRRVSHDEDTLKQDLGPTSPVKADPRSRQQTGGQVAEERKRGRRLFGALLGTLSQSSSSSTAHKRRSDIEKKQQAKLKQQTEEADEQKKEKLEALMKVRRKEQRIYDRESMKIRHSNLIAQAHYLRTKAGPELFYKPWKLTAGDDETIEAQIKGAEAKTKAELTQWEADNPPPVEDLVSDEPPKEAKEEEDTDMKIVGEDSNEQKRPERDITPLTNGHDTLTNDKHNLTEASEASNHHGTEGEEMVEGEEDTVIY